MTPIIHKVLAYYRATEEPRWRTICDCTTLYPEHGQHLMCHHDPLVASPTLRALAGQIVCSFSEVLIHRRTQQTLFCSRDHSMCRDLLGGIRDRARSPSMVASCQGKCLRIMSVITKVSTPLRCFGACTDFRSSIVCRQYRSALQSSLENILGGKPPQIHVCIWFCGNTTASCGDVK